MTPDQIRLQILNARDELPEVCEILLRMLPPQRKKWIEYAEVKEDER